MHEASVVRNLIEIILEECHKENLEHPNKILLELGELTNYKKEAIEFYFDLTKKEYSVLSFVALEIIVIPGEVECLDCKKTSIITEKFMIFCPECNSSNVNVIKGRDFVIKDIKEKQNV